MMIRTVLVGLVASLGLTLPSGKQVDSWKRSAESWVNARLAEWDGQMPNDGNAFVYVSEPAPAPPSPAAEPATAPKAPEVAKADEKVAAPAARVVASPAPVAESVAMPVVPTEPVAMADDDVSPAAEIVSDAAFLAALDDSVAVFAADIARAETPVVVSRETAGDEILVLMEDEAVFTNGQGTEGLCVLDEPTRKPVAPVATVEPAMSGDESDAAIAFGFDEPEAPTEATPCVSPAVVPEPAQVLASVSTAPHSGDTLTRAVRLTREAVFAWASLLHGPAVVTITP